jgi:Ca-activated chloride channel homolog
LIFLSLWFKKAVLYKGQEELFLLIIDQSLSMAIEDIDTVWMQNISRLDKVKEMIRSTAYEWQKIWVILFAKNPTLLIPISSEVWKFHDIIWSIEPEPDLWWSDLPLAIQFAKNLYGNIKLQVTIYTDGWSTSMVTPPKIPQNWRVKIYWVWSEVWWKIPLGYNANGERRYKFFSWSEVILPYEKKELEKLSKVLSATLIDWDKTNLGENVLLENFFRNNTNYLLASLFLLLGIIIHPYGRKKISN